MTWEIVVGIIALCGFVASVASWVSKLSKTLASLQITLDALNKTLDEFKESNRESHRKFYDQLGQHEIRIQRLEDSGFGKRDESKISPP